jgi:hypothetical protein
MHRAAGCGIEHSEAGCVIQVNNEQLGVRYMWAQNRWVWDTCEHRAAGYEIQVNTEKLDMRYKWTQSICILYTSEHRASGSYIQVNTEHLDLIYKWTQSIWILYTSEHRAAGREINMNTEQLGVRYMWTQSIWIWYTSGHRDTYEHRVRLKIRGGTVQHWNEPNQLVEIRWASGRDTCENESSGWLWLTEINVNIHGAASWLI